MSVVVRAAQDGEGLEVAALWRELGITNTPQEPNR